MVCSCCDMDTMAINAVNSEPNEAEMKLTRAHGMKSRTSNVKRMRRDAELNPKKRFTRDVQMTKRRWRVEQRACVLDTHHRRSDH